MTDLAISRISLTEIQEILGGFQGEISQFDLERVRVPTGGSINWEIPALEGPTASRELSGVIVAWTRQRSYWSASPEETGGAQAPNCSSPDGILGFGDPGGNCSQCPFAKWGSRTDSSRGQACKEQIALFLLRNDTIMPTVLVVPPTSVVNVRRYFVSLASRAVPYWGVHTGFTLDKKMSNGNQPYAVVTPRVIDKLDAETADKAREMSVLLKPILTKRVFDAGEELANDAE